MQHRGWGLRWARELMQPNAGCGGAGARMKRMLWRSVYAGWGARWGASWARQGRSDSY